VLISDTAIKGKPGSDSTEPSTYGVPLALRKYGPARKVKLIGFDLSEELLKALRSGEISALAMQDPVQMAYLAVESMPARRSNSPENRHQSPYRHP